MSCICVAVRRQTGSLLELGVGGRTVGNGGVETVAVVLGDLGKDVVGRGKLKLEENGKCLGCLGLMSLCLASISFARPMA